MTWQTDRIRDHVFPISIVEQHSTGFRMVRFGTAFLIGTRGYALTAAHMIDKTTETLAGLFLPPDNSWTALLVEGQELHPSEDVALIKLQGNEWTSIFAISSEHVFASSNYESFGYLEDALHENLDNSLPDGSVLPRPDLVFTRGDVSPHLLESTHSWRCWNILC